MHLDSRRIPRSLFPSLAGLSFVLVLLYLLYGAQSTGWAGPILIFLAILLAFQLWVQVDLTQRLHYAEKESEKQQRQAAEQARSVNALRMAHEEAICADHVKRIFINSISHELRTTLNSVMGVVRFLSVRQSLEPNEKDCLFSLEESADSLLGHIDDILVSNALESGTLVLREEVFDPTEIVRDLQAKMEALAQRKEFPLVFQPDPALPTKVRGDAQQFIRCLRTLAANAVHYHGGGPVELRFVWNGAHDMLQVTVQDAGKCLPMDASSGEILPKREVPTPAQEAEELGLGLPLVLRVLDFVGGHLSAEVLSEGSGASYFLHFPLKQIKPLALSNAPTSPEEGFASTAESFHILVVDDNDLNRKVLRMILKKQGLFCEEAGSGEEALQILEGNFFDLVLMDVEMPGIGGLEATRQLRARQWAESRSFVIALTANAQPDDRQVCLEAGMDEYLPKPVDAVRLLKWIDRLRALPAGLRQGLSARVGVLGSAGPAV